MAVYALKKDCCCNPRLSLRRIGPGKYAMGESKKPLMMRCVGKTPMVRIGGGWENLRTFLAAHDKYVGFYRPISVSGTNKNKKTLPLST